MAANITYESKPWLKSYEKGVPENIKYEELSMPDYLEKSAKEFPDNTAMIFRVQVDIPPVERSGGPICHLPYGFRYQKGGCRIDSPA